jgi:hypothetical protein
MTFFTAEFQQTSTYAMRRFREAYRAAGGLTPGVWHGLEVTSAAGMNVSVAPGSAVIDGEGLTTEGFYTVENDAALTVPLTAAHGTLPRIDQVYVTVTDTTDISGSGSNSGVIGVLTGTATAGADLVNRTGAGTLPAGRARLADLLIPAGTSTLVTSSHIRDRRIMARGMVRPQTTTFVDANSNGATVQTAPVNPNPTIPGIRAGNIFRFESSGLPALVQFNGLAKLNVLGVGATLPQTIGMEAMYSTTHTGGGTGTWAVMNGHWIGNPIEFLQVGVYQHFNFNVWWMPPAPGSYAIGMWIYAIGAAGSAPITEVLVRGGSPAPAGEAMHIYVEELTQSFQTNRPN